jgi:hypothetical protein
VVARRSSRWLSAGIAPLIALAALGASAPVVAAADQLQDSAVATYELRPDRGVVHVTTKLTLTNRAPSTSKSWDCSYITLDPYGYTYLVKATCTRHTDYYYNQYDMWVEREATAFKAKASSGSASVRPSKRKGDWRVVQLKFSPLYYGKTRTITLSYDLPAGGPRSTRDRRVGYVYSSFCSSGPGADKGRVQVIVPAGYDMRVTATMKSTTGSGKTTYDTGLLKSKPWEFYACFTGENEAGYVSTPVSTSDGHTVTIQSWKEDKAWADAVKASVAEDLPALRTLLGDLPLGDDLTIRESLAKRPLIDDPATATHSLSEAVATRAAVTDDLAHLWIPRNALNTAWLIEGYAAWAQRQSGTSSALCEEPHADAAIQQDLGTWARLGSAPTQADRDTVAYQRQAACHLISEVAAAIGPDRLVETLGAMRDGADPWRPTDATSRTTSFGWRTWMDLVTERGYVPAGADPARLSELLAAYGVADDAAELTARAETHAAYHELAAAMGDRPTPKAVTDALGQWDFEAAGAAITSARSAWQDVASVASRLPSIDVDRGAVQLAVVNAASQADLDAAAGQAATQASLASGLADALAKQDAPRDPLQSLGLLGAAVPDTATLVDAVARVDSGVATSGIDAINASLDSARDVGLQRLAIGLVALVIVLLAGWFVSRRVRSSRRAAAGADPESAES